MRYIKYCLDIGYAGCDYVDVMEIEDGIPDQSLNENLNDELYDYAESMEHVAEGYDPDEGWESEQDSDDYYENCSYSWEEITEEEYKEFLGIEDEED